MTGTGDLSGGDTLAAEAWQGVAPPRAAIGCLACSWARRGPCLRGVTVSVESVSGNVSVKFKP